MIRIADIVQVLEKWAPPQYAESYDTAGLLWGGPQQPVQGVLTTLDITPAIVQEAREVGATLLVAHHPIWFGPKTRLQWEVYADRLILQLIQAGLAVYAMHTNLDQVPEGVNFHLCKALGLQPVGFLRPVGPGYGAGYIGEWNQPLEPSRFLAHVKQALGAQSLRFTSGPETPIRRVAVCGGAGSFLLSEALAAGVEAFVTADVPYHRFLEAQERLWLVDVGHYESEHRIAEVMAAYLRAHFPDLPVFSTRICTNPVHYWI